VGPYWCALFNAKCAAQASVARRQEAGRSDLATRGAQSARRTTQTGPSVVDEFTREALAIRIDRRLRSTEVIDTLADLFILGGISGHIRSDNGSEFIAAAVKDWIAAVGVKTAYIEKGSPWENGYIESFNGKLRDELLYGEVFYSVRETQLVTEQWRQHYNTIRPHSSLGYRPTGVGGHHTCWQPAYSAAAAATLTLPVVPTVGAGQ
jgi:putative transposase